MKMIVNPGTGPVQEACEEEAAKNIRQFVADLGIEGLQCMRMPERDDGEGRFAWLLFRDRSAQGCQIDMPGLPLPHVRYVSEEQNAWHYPRLYVDGNSWLWSFAIDLHEAGRPDVAVPPR